MSAITRDPETRGGEPCIAGTRIPVAMLLAELIEGTITTFAVDRDLPITLCVAAAEQAIEEYAKPNEILARLYAGCNPECPGCGAVPCNENGDAVLWCDECYGLLQEQVEMLRDIGRIVRRGEVTLGHDEWTDSLLVNCPRFAEELHDLLRKAAEAGGDDESDV